jgi:hypothetical protein
MRLAREPGADSYRLLAVVTWAGECREHPVVGRTTDGSRTKLPADDRTKTPSPALRSPRPRARTWRSADLIRSGWLPGDLSPEYANPHAPPVADDAINLWWSNQVMGLVVPGVLLRAVTWHEPDQAGWRAGQLGFTPQQPPARDRCQWR